MLTHQLDVTAAMSSNCSGKETERKKGKERPLNVYEVMCHVIAGIHNSEWCVLTQDVLNKYREVRILGIRVDRCKYTWT